MLVVGKCSQALCEHVVIDILKLMNGTSFVCDLFVFVLRALTWVWLLALHPLVASLQTI